MRAEERAMLDLWPDVTGRRALDLACGTGRYSRRLSEAGAADVTAVDFCPPMLARAVVAGRVCANMMQLPFANNAFDVVISGLAIGHATDAYAWMDEMARVTAGGGVLLYSDFHPAAARAGLPRTFKDQHEVVIVPHRIHDVSVQCAAAAAAGLHVEKVCEIRAGMELQEKFSHSDEFYRTWHGLPILLIVRAHK
jgi:ubiquinone/menaquinone biosynthesis C-methylase UbiE